MPYQQFLASKNKVPLLTQSKTIIPQFLSGLAATKPTKAVESDLSTFRTVTFALQQHLATLGIVRDWSSLVPGTVHTHQRSTLCLSIVTSSEKISSFHNTSIKNRYHEVSSRGICFLLWIVEEAWSGDLTQVVLLVKIPSLGQINAIKGYILLALCKQRSKR